MSEKSQWQLKLDKCVDKNKPEQIKRARAWKTAIGLQDVDGLDVSEYLLCVAQSHIDGEISINDVIEQIRNHYKNCPDMAERLSETKEADFVSSRIVKLLEDDSCDFSPTELINIHRHIFKDAFHHTGRIRKYDIAKKEWVLSGDSVIYAPCGGIRDMLDYDFSTEKRFNYKDTSTEESIKHLAQFISNIWQIHPFGEGNTRTTAVFMLKYLKTLSLISTSDAFASNSWYFRNALVRANYNNVSKGIYSTTKYLEMFLSNLIIGANYALDNRHLHMDYIDNQDI